MAKLSITKAAQEWGVHRSTLQRAIKQGKISASVAGKNAKTVDTSELLRVFGEPKVLQSYVASNTKSSSKLQDVILENAILKKDVEYLNKENDLLRQQLDKMQSMLPLMLTHQTKSWWKRMFE